MLSYDFFKFSKNSKEILGLLQLLVPTQRDASKLELSSNCCKVPKMYTGEDQINEAKLNLGLKLDLLS